MEQKERGGMKPSSEAVAAVLRDSEEEAVTEDWNCRERTDPPAAGI